MDIYMLFDGLNIRTHLIENYQYLLLWFMTYMQPITILILFTMAK